MKPKFRGKGCDFGDFIWETIIFLLLITVSMFCTSSRKNGHGWVNIVTIVPMQGPYVGLHVECPLLYILLLDQKFFSPSYNREDAYSRTGSIFIRDTARDTAYSLWFNEVWPYASLNHNEYAVSRAVSRMKMPPVREYASSLISFILYVLNIAQFMSRVIKRFLQRRTQILSSKGSTWGEI